MCQMWVISPEKKFQFSSSVWIRLKLGSGFILETWEPILAQQLLPSMDSTNLWSTTLFLSAAGKEKRLNILEVVSCMIGWFGFIKRVGNVN